MPIFSDVYRSIIRCARGYEPADVVVRGGRIINVFTGEILDADIAIKDGFIARIGDVSDIIGSNTKIFDVKGMYVSPAFIDAHIHIESSLLNPSEFAKAVIPHGTGAVITDFHELANVLGYEGLKLMLNEVSRLPLHIFVALPSCVPAAPGIDTSGAELSAEDLAKLIDNPYVVGLGEMMNFPGVLNLDPEVWKKILLAHHKKIVVDGHAPLLLGRDLQAYIAAGIHSDHESTTEEEAIQKLRLGMYLLAREGSAAKNLDIIRRIKDNYVALERTIIVTDDKHVDDLIENGHLEPAIKRAIEMGIDPIRAIRMVTINPARAYGLRALGGLAPGYLGDIVVLENLENIRVKYVFLNGKLQAKDGKFLGNIGKFDYPDFSLNTIRIKKKLSDSDLKIFLPKGKLRLHIIGAREGSILTDHIKKDIYSNGATFKPNLEDDILEIAVVERHKKTGNIGKGFISGFGIKSGAIATSISHDSHNIICIGTNIPDMVLAINTIIDMQGGIAITKNGKVIGKLPLRLAGLMSIENAETVYKKTKKIKTAIKQLEPKIEEPLMTLSFMALPVIPKLKITDKGLFDTEKFTHITPIENLVPNNDT